MSSFRSCSHLVICLATGEIAARITAVAGSWGSCCRTVYQLSSSHRCYSLKLWSCQRICSSLSLFGRLRVAAVLVRYWDLTFCCPSYAWERRGWRSRSRRLARFFERITRREAYLKLDYYLGIAIALSWLCSLDVSSSYWSSHLGVKERLNSWWVLGKERQTETSTTTIPHLARRFGGRSWGILLRWGHRRWIVLCRR